jgi:membrane protease YdiL (CAAX protease family)
MARTAKLGLAAFFLVAFAVPWTGWLLVRNEALSLWLFPLFASIAGFAASFAEGGLPGLAAFSRRGLISLRALPCVLAAVLIPVAMGLTYLFATGAIGVGTVVSPGAIASLSLGAALVTGPLAEEFGWRGYLQPKLLGRLAPFWAALAVGCIWWAWHFALYRDSVFATVPSALRFLAYLQTWSIFMVFLVQRAGGSVWPAVALHWAANTHPGVLQALLPSVDGGALPGGSKGWLFYLGAAVMFAALNHRFFFTRQAGAVVMPATANHSPKPTPLRRAA